MNTNKHELPSQELRDQLAEAIQASNINVAEKLLTSEPLLANSDLRKPKDRDSFSHGHPLHQACERNNEELADFLLNHGAHALSLIHISEPTRPY